ncbi:MAG: PQQ-binding-like beta-propeller repeat protein [Planctomycetota bacterium]
MGIAALVIVAGALTAAWAQEAGAAGRQQAVPRREGQPHGGWSQFGGPHRAFVAPAEPRPEPFDPSGPPLLWEAALGPGNSGVISRAGVVWTALRRGEHEVVVAFDAASGGRLWEHAEHAPLPESADPEFGVGPHSTPVVADDLVFFAGATGHLVALEASTGALRWRLRLWEDLRGTALERGYAASPLALDLAPGQRLLVVAVGGVDPVTHQGRGLMAFERATGAVRWAAEPSAATYASPIAVDLGGSLQVVALLEDALVGVDPGDGSRRWRVPISSERFALCNTPVDCGDGRIFIVTAAGGALVHVRESNPGEYTVDERWTSRRIGAQQHNALRLGELLIGANETATTNALALSDGRALVRSRALRDATLLAAGSTLVALTADGELVVAELTSKDPRQLELEVTARAQVLTGRVWAAPALDGGILYLRDDTLLRALRLSAGPR